MMLDETTLHWLTRRGVAEIIEEREFRRLLTKGDPLRLKMGFDPSSPDIHLGHVVGLRKLRQLQDLGHQVVVIVGDWTAQIGDPSGRSATRPVLSHAEVLANAETYLAQFFKVVDRDRTEVVFQSDWFGTFTLADVIELTSRFTLAQFLQRDDFRKRWESNRPIAITEFLYPLLQAYDSVVVRADVEFGGTDQRFNLLVGRELQVMMGQLPQQCFMVPILVGTDGVLKMSKSLGNYIGVDEPPREQYGKIMSLPDRLIIPYLELLTDVPDAELAEVRLALDEGEVNPMEWKKRLAREVVTQFWGASAAKEAEGNFEQLFQRREAPEDLPKRRFTRETAPSGAVSFRFESEGDGEVTVPEDAPAVGALADLGLAASRTEAKRLVSQGSVEVDGERVTGSLPIRDQAVVRVGKRRFLRLVEAKDGDL